MLAFAVPIAGSWLRNGRKDRCALDGCAIEPAFQVLLMAEREKSYRFCCVNCAEIWFERSAIEPQGIIVTDEVTGKQIDAAIAHFVRSSVVSVPTSGSCIHVFANAADAEQHAETCQGTVLSESERPFRK